MLKTSLNKQKKRPLKTQNWIFRGRYRAVPPHLITFQQQLSTYRVRLVDSIGFIETESGTKPQVHFVVPNIYSRNVEQKVTDATELRKSND